MTLKPGTRKNALHNYQEVMEQTYAAIDLLEKDPEVRKALKGFATAMTVAETNAGQYGMLHNGRQYIGPYQMNKTHAFAMRNSKEGLALRERLMEEEALPAKDRNPQAQYLLNSGATAGVWTVSRANPYQNQGVLGAVSTVIAAKAAAKATGTPIQDLDAAEVWMPHKLGINGGTAVLKARAENPDTRVRDIESPYGTAVSKAAYNNNFNGSYQSATVEDIYDKTRAKFEKKVDEGVTNRLSASQKSLFFAAANIERSPKETPVQVAQIPLPPKRPDGLEQEARPVTASSHNYEKTPNPSPSIKIADAEKEKPLKPLAPLTTLANTNFRHLSNNLVGMGKIEADMKPEMRAQKLAEYIKENGGVETALEQSKIVISQMQKELHASGVLNGAIDGLYGKKTQAAQEAYRLANKKDPDVITTQVAKTNTRPVVIEPPPPPAASQANLPSPSPTPVVVAGANGRGARV